MLKVMTTGATLHEALANAERHALDSLTVDGEVPPFQRVNVELATTAPVEGETVRFAGSVTFQVTHEPYGITVDHEGMVTAVDIPDVKGLKVRGRDLAAIKKVLAEPPVNVELPPKGRV